MIDQQIQPLTPYHVSGWEYTTNAGYYVHSDRVFVQGCVDTWDGSAGSGTLLAGFPSSLRPASGVPVKVLIDFTNSTEDYAPDSALHVGPFFNATVNPSGSVTFDSGNPNNHDPDSRLSISFAFSWPIAGSSKADTYAPSSLSPYVSSVANVGVDSYQNVDGTIASHGSRLHLGGHIRAGSRVGDYYPLVGIGSHDVPFALGSAIYNGSYWTEVPSNNGYNCGVNIGGSSLWSNGSLSPPAGNNGCSILANTFHRHWRSGFLARGSYPTFNPPLDSGDAGIGYTGFSNFPVSPLPSVARWDGTAFTVSLEIDRPSLGADITGSGQFCYIVCAGGASYYKIILTLATVGSPPHVIAQVWHVDTSGSLTHQIGGADLEAGQTALDPLKSNVGFTLNVYPYNPFGVTNPGSLYLQFRNSNIIDNTPGIKSSVGQCGAHYPNGLTGLREEVLIAGIGDFPTMVEGDVIDFADCGWGITFAPPVDEILLGIV